MENKKTLPLKKKISNDSFATLKKFWKSQDSSTLALLCSKAKSQFIDNKAGLILLPFLKVRFPKRSSVISPHILLPKIVPYVYSPEPLTGKGSPISIAGLDQRFSTLSILKNHRGGF